jgi:hypothetical protein
MGIVALLCCSACFTGRLFGQWATGSGGAIYYNGGNVGIGANPPANGKLEVYDVNVTDPPILTFAGNSTAVPSNYFGGSIMYNFTGGQTEVALWNRFWSSARAFDFIQATSVSPYYTRLMTILSNGNVGIGTTNPQNLLSVSGTIQAKEVIVNTGWSDYVFDPGYHLRPLSDVAAYIKENHHLPDIPSGAEVKGKGVSVGMMESKLLAKVEELTLEMIQMNEENKALKERLDRLEKH